MLVARARAAYLEASTWPEQLSCESMARLVLEDGCEYQGKLFGGSKSTPGEVGTWLEFAVSLLIEIIVYSVSDWDGRLS